MLVAIGAMLVGCGGQVDPVMNTVNPGAGGAAGETSVALGGAAGDASGLGGAAGDDWGLGGSGTDSEPADSIRWGVRPWRRLHPGDLVLLRFLLQQGLLSHLLHVQEGFVQLQCLLLTDTLSP